MKEQIEKMLHQPVDIMPFDDDCNMPLSFKARYLLYYMEINGIHCVLMEPQEGMTLTVIRKQHRKMEQLTEQYCVLYFKSMSPYPREKMMEEGIPFIWEDHQIYMPFIGMVLKQNEAREIKTCERISFLTQKMLLMALYEQWQNATVTKVALALDVSKMSVTRCFDEIEALEISYLQKKGKTRFLRMTGDKKEQWSVLQPFMRPPLIRTFRLDEEIKFALPYSGMTALGEYSMIADNAYKTYAITKAQLSESGIREMHSIYANESPVCVVQELGYVIDYKGSGMIDPLSLSLLMEQERDDPRVDKAVDEMLEEYVW